MPDPMLGNGAVTATLRGKVFLPMSQTIDELTFDVEAERTLHALEVSLNEVDGVEADLESGILTVEFEDGARFVINSHRAARQIWLAAGAEAWHFDVNPATSRWTATKTGEEIWACIEEQVSKKLARPIQLERMATA